MGSMTRRLRRAREDRRNGKLVGATGAQGRRLFAEIARAFARDRAKAKAKAA